MTPQKFIEFGVKWIPNYNSKKIRDKQREFQLDDFAFTLCYFDEAIEAFAKAQRQICADVYENNCVYSTGINNYEAILNAPTP